MQILLIGRAFYTAPVVTIQRRLAELYRFRVVSSLALGLTWWVLLRNVIDDLAGRSLLWASRRLDEIAQFEQG